MRGAVLILASGLLLALAAPTLVDPASVARMMRAESEGHAVLRGAGADAVALMRALGWLAPATADHPVPDAQLALRPADPLSQRLAAAGRNVLATPYPQRAIALARLAMYRVAVLTGWLQLLLPVVVAALLDGAVMRKVRTRSLILPSPVSFGIGLHGAIVTAAAIAVALLLPVPLPALIWPGLLALLTLALRAAVVNFHRIR